MQREENRQWRSVLCWGTFEELDFEKLDKAEAVDITKRLTGILGGIQDTVGVSVPFAFTEKATPLSVNSRKSTLFRILITEKTGRFYGAEQ